MVQTPVAFFIFNRPEPTERVFAEIAKAQPQRLFVIADGPRTPEEKIKCDLTRAVTDRIDWPCEVSRCYSETNLGCGKCVSAGIDWIFSQVEEAIILEDDCLPHPDFFGFCEQMLERYRDDPRVMMIGGSNFLQDRLQIPESYIFSSYYAVWGWATWRRAWALYDITMPGWPEFRNQKQLEGLYCHDHVRAYFYHLFNSAATMNSWALQWAYTCMFHHGLSIVPRVNLISNIGLFGAHAQGDTTNLNFPVFDLGLENLTHPVHMFADSRYDRPFFERTFHRQRPPSLVARIKDRLRPMIPKSLLARRRKAHVL